jgi:hypothetical protein
MQTGEEVGIKLVRREEEEENAAGQRRRKTTGFDIALFFLAHLFSLALSSLLSLQSLTA